jgi:hypothetical protein
MSGNTAWMGGNHHSYVSIAKVNAYQEQVDSMLLQHDSDHPDSTSTAIWWQSRRITGEKQGSGNFADKASHSCFVGLKEMNMNHDKEAILVVTS